MSKVELSLWIEQNYPATATSISQRKPRYGVGVNDASYITTPRVNGVKLWDPAYLAWVGMLERAYSERYHAEKPTYSDITVCSTWHSFRAFRAWWLSNYREGDNLDKDLLVVGNREYSPDACIYVPIWLNTFTVDRGACRGDFPIGVSIHKQTGKYQSRCSNPIAGNRCFLGYFNTPEAAHAAWLKCKLELADQLKPQMDAIDQRIYNNVVTIIKALV